MLIYLDLKLVLVSWSLSSGLLLLVLVLMTGVLVE